MKENEQIDALLKAHGFMYDENSEEWIKDNWNIRIINNELEVFQSYSIDNNRVLKYFYTKYNLEILQEILKEI